MALELQTLARDEAANQWVESNVSSSLAEKLRSWARGMLDKYDADDQAQVGVLLTEPCRPFDSQQGVLPSRAHIYALIFTWDDGREQKVLRAALYVNDANEIIDFVPVDKE
jgi:hypothetical protein